MYETAVPDETRQRLEELAPAPLVVGIPSYRNARTVGAVVARVAAGLDAHYAALQPLIVHADGHSFDETLSLAAHVPLPPSVRRIATRYQGLPGKGSALRAIFEVARHLQAQAVLLVEADHLTFEPQWVEQLLAPVLRREVELSLPLYHTLRPALASADLILHPLLASMFNVPTRQPTGGEVALAGGVVNFFVERDVWETDVARAGVDIWMTAQVALGEGRLGQVHLGAKLHRSHEAASLAEATFLQEVGTLFRLAHLHARAWQQGGAQPSGVTTLGEPPDRTAPPLDMLAESIAQRRAAQRAVKPGVEALWQEILLPRHLQAVRQLVALPEGQSAFDDELWARVVYDFVVVYNLGEGDPDKVVTALYPLFLLRHAALLAEAAQHSAPAAARERLVQRQVQAFVSQLDYLLQRWEGYVSPEQISLWRELGLLSG